jgi:transposase
VPRGKMLDAMERSAIKLLKRRGLSNVRIGAVVGRHRTTVTAALHEPAEVRRQRQRGSQIDRWRAEVETWLSHGTPVRRMWELARDGEPPYTGSRSAFYAGVSRIREAVHRAAVDAVVRFDGLPGEYLQVDWGEVRRMPFSRPDLCETTRYFFAARLKHSRYMVVQWTRDMELETLIRSLLRVFERIGGVPWVVTFDNMRQVTTGRDVDGHPLWTPAFRKVATEIGFHPEVCALNAPNQKGAVENLVGFVKHNFIPERSFVDDADLAEQQDVWLDRVNGEVSQAHGAKPIDVLSTEQAAFGPVTTTATDYGVLHLLKVTPESVIHLATNRYSVPVAYIGQTVVVRATAGLVRIIHDQTVIAEHRRCYLRNKRIRECSHYEEVLRRKPRARVMLYRGELLELGPVVQTYVTTICRRMRESLAPQILELHRLWQAHGPDRFTSAIGCLQTAQIFGAEYVGALLGRDEPTWHDAVVWLQGVPAQTQVDRDLAIYERYVQ